MARYRKLNYFVPFASNTIDDFTGFKVKSTQVIRQWDGLYGVPQAVSIRQPQDFAPNIIPTMVFPNTRFQYPIVEGDYQIPNTDVVASDGTAYTVSNVVVDSLGGTWTVVDDVLASNGSRYFLFELPLQRIVV